MFFHYRNEGYSNMKKKVQKIFYNVIIYGFLVIMGFVFLFPLLKMISLSFMTSEDLVNPLVNWVPYEFSTENFERAIQVLGYGETLWTTTYVSLLPAILQTFACSLVGYGLARYKFVGNKIVFAMVLATFIIPSQVTMIPQFLMYKNLGILYSLNAYLLPAAFGQGFRSSIFILIFYSFYKQMPVSLVEAAEVDGANQFQVFWKIAIPIAKPGFLISFLLSTVWYWNETYLSSLYFGSNIKTLPIKLQTFVDSFNEMVSASEATAGISANEAVQMAGTFLVIFPLLVLYAFTQKWFVEGIDKSGITGE